MIHWSPQGLRLRTFNGSKVSSFDFSTLYTSLPYDLIKAKVLSFVKWCFDRESKTYLCTSAKAGFFSNKKYDWHACWTCTELCEPFTFLMENIYVQFDGMVNQQIVGIPMGTNCAPVSMEHLQRVWHASRERLPFRTPGSVPHFGTC